MDYFARLAIALFEAAYAADSRMVARYLRDEKMKRVAAGIAPPPGWSARP